ncbi:RNA-directed DNA polymerase [Vibrio splendidus]|uniref:RNA-directed DNA polymerase n=1 Tax=Vibrio splendidus TaxID=29497 RepID=A0A2T5EIC6_VIBSP|nr:RNA-directed DNA polymerase [Vibrio splendidus]
MMFKLYFKLSKKLELSRSRIESFSKNAPNMYKVYTIPKRTSGRRVIAHPSRELKVYQRALVEILASSFEPHHCSFAYRKQLSIKENALVHSRNSYLLKMDFSEFFNSIEPDMLFSAAKVRNIGLSDAEKRLVENLVFWNKTKSHNTKLVLSVGAPSSPLISNFIMFEFDRLMYEFSKNNSIVYTRYADDITFSTNRKNTLFDVPNEVNRVLSKFYDYRISINSTKTVFSSKAHNRHITGVTITNDGKLSIGRSRKRMISSLIHQFTLKKIDSCDFSYLQGLLSFASHIEPSFIFSMKSKYGDEIITQIIKGDFS